MNMPLVEIMSSPDPPILTARPGIFKLQVSDVFSYDGTRHIIRLKDDSVSNFSRFPYASRHVANIFRFNQVQPTDYSLFMCLICHVLLLIPYIFILPNMVFLHRIIIMTSISSSTASRWWSRITLPHMFSFATTGYYTWIILLNTYSLQNYC